MRFITIISILFMLALIIFYITLSYQPFLSRDVELVNIVLDKGAKIIKRKYDLIPIGSGVSMPGGPIKELSLSFNTKRPYSKEELRELLIKTAQELVNLVNQNQEIQQYIKEPPFTIKNTNITIYICDKSGQDVFHPNIALSQISEGILIYRTVDADDIYGYRDRYQESYEEALRALLSAVLKSPSPQEKI